MQRGSLLHDVGKIGVSDSILLKPGKLTDDEWGKMREHPEIGFNMLRQVKFLSGAAEIILAHHERWDGDGYPDGLSGEEIPLEARITSIADVFDALSTKRSYKPAFPTEKCFTILEEGRAKSFDPMVLDAFFASKDKILQVQRDYADCE